MSAKPPSGVKTLVQRGIIPIPQVIRGDAGQGIAEADRQSDEAAMEEIANRHEHYLSLSVKALRRFVEMFNSAAVSHELPYHFHVREDAVRGVLESALTESPWAELMVKIDRGVFSEILPQAEVTATVMGLSVCRRVSVKEKWGGKKVNLFGKGEQSIKTMIQLFVWRVWPCLRYIETGKSPLSLFLLYPSKNDTPKTKRDETVVMAVLRALEIEVVATGKRWGFNQILINSTQKYCDTMPRNPSKSNINTLSAIIGQAERDRRELLIVMDECDYGGGQGSFTYKYFSEIPLTDSGRTIRDMLQDDQTPITLSGWSATLGDFDRCDAHVEKWFLHSCEEYVPLENVDKCTLNELAERYDSTFLNFVGTKSGSRSHVYEDREAFQKHVLSTPMHVLTLTTKGVLPKSDEEWGQSHGRFKDEIVPKAFTDLLVAVKNEGRYKVVTIRYINNNNASKQLADATEAMTAKLADTAKSLEGGKHNIVIVNFNSQERYRTEDRAIPHISSAQEPETFIREYRKLVPGSEDALFVMFLSSAGRRAVRFPNDTLQIEFGDAQTTRATRQTDGRSAKIRSKSALVMNRQRYRSHEDGLSLLTASPNVTSGRPARPRVYLELTEANAQEIPQLREWWEKAADWIELMKFGNKPSGGLSLWDECEKRKLPFFDFISIESLFDLLEEHQDVIAPYVREKIRFLRFGTGTKRNTNKRAIARAKEGEQISTKTKFVIRYPYQYPVFIKGRKRVVPFGIRSTTHDTGIQWNLLSNDLYANPFADNDMWRDIRLSNNHRVALPQMYIPPTKRLEKICLLLETEVGERGKNLPKDRTFAWALLSDKEQEEVRHERMFRS